MGSGSSRNSAAENTMTPAPSPTPVHALRAQASPAPTRLPTRTEMAALMLMGSMNEMLARVSTTPLAASASGLIQPIMKETALKAQTSLASWAPSGMPTLNSAPSAAGERTSSQRSGASAARSSAREIQASRAKLAKRARVVAQPAPTTPSPAQSPTP